MTLCTLCGRTPFSLSTGTLQMCRPCGDQFIRPIVSTIPQKTTCDAGLRGYAEHAAADYLAWWEENNPRFYKHNGDLV